MIDHADLTTLLAYWLGELDEHREAAVEEHYLGCGECSARLAEVEALAAGVRHAFALGEVGCVLTPAFVGQLQARGLRVREYRVPRNGSVNCSVGPEDQMLLSRLEAPLEGIERLDLLVGSPQPVAPNRTVTPSPTVTPAQAGAQFRLEDIPFDATAGEVIVAPSIAHIRALPSHVQVMRLVAVTEQGDRVLGEYTFNHSAG